MRLQIVQLASLLLAAFVLVACPKIEDLPESDLSCLLTLAEGTDSPVPSGEAVELLVAAHGGTAPYKLVGVIGTFEESTQISRTYSNETDDVVAQEDSVIVFDSHGFSTQCFATFDVDIAADDTDTDTDTDVVTDPEVSATVSPSASVVNTTNIIMTASSDGFDSVDVTYTFEFDEDGVQLGQDMNVATFSVTDDGAHTFTVTVTAMSATEEATITVDLEFTEPAATSLDCTLEREEGPYVTDKAVNFTLSTTAADELEFLTFSAGVDGSAFLAVDESVNTTWTSSGVKFISVTARSKDTGMLCNGGTPMMDVITIANPLSCNAYTQYSQYYIYQEFGVNYIVAPYSEQIWAWVTPSNAVGDVTVTSVSSAASGYYNLYANDYPRWAEVYLNETGNFTLTLSIEDESGATATCTTPSFDVDNWYY